ncbi:MAG: hypothetical protein D6675_13635 [Gemmatimonadetes bacterium]|nr:MAG: hypothetical protein D6675_13635 [Gemmatimonadota bacterium]
MYAFGSDLFGQPAHSLQIELALPERPGVALPAEAVSAASHVIQVKNGVWNPLHDIYHTSRQDWLVLGLNETHKVAPARIYTIQHAQKGRLYRLVTRRGRELVATENVRLLTPTGWTALKLLKRGAFIASLRHIPFRLTRSLYHHQLILLGYLLSDATALSEDKITFSARQKSHVEDFTHHIHQFEHTHVEIEGWHGREAVILTATHELPHISALIEWVDQLGLVSEKQLPKLVFTLSHTDVALLMGRLWSVCGKVVLDANKTIFFTTSTRLARQLQHLLLRFGIISKLETTRRQSRLVVSGSYYLHRFYQTFTRFLLGTVSRNLKKWYRRQRVTNGTTFLETDPIPTALLPTDDPAMSTIGDQQQYIQRRRLYQLYQRHPAIELKTIIESDIYWDRVRSTKPDPSPFRESIKLVTSDAVAVNDLIVKFGHT